MDNLVSALRQNLEFTLWDLWGNQPRGVPAWVPLVVAPAAIKRTLELARDASVELGVPADFLLRVSPAELATFWAIVFRQLWDTELPRNPVNPNEAEYLVAHQIASSVFTMHQQSTKYRNFLRFGPPPGVRQFPQYTVSERTKTLAIPWAWHRTAAQSARANQYSSCVQGRARRVQSLRSQQCTVSDVLNPSVFN
jgi:hypothetical protein